MDDHRALLSAAESDMIGLAVPERKKSASLTELMKASWRTTGSGLIRLTVTFGDVEDALEKCKVNLKGSGRGESGALEERA